MEEKGKMDQETPESTLICILIVESENKKKESENGIGERILKKRGYMEKHYQIIRIQKLNNFITDRLQMSKKKNNDEQNQTNVWLAREEGCFGPEAPAPPPAAVTTRIIVQSPQLLGKKAHSLRQGREREREMHIHIPRIQDTRTRTSSSKDYRSKQLQIGREQTLQKKKRMKNQNVKNRQSIEKNPL